MLSQTMEEIHKLRGQLTALVATNFADKELVKSTQLRPPSQAQVRHLRIAYC